MLAAALPAGGQAGPDVIVAVSIRSVTVDSAGPFKAGDVLHVTLAGSPGGRASFTVPNVCGEIPMPEGRPGVYTGLLAIPKNIDVARAAVIGRLIGKGGTAAPLLAAGQTIAIYNSPPVIWAQTPPAESNVATGQPYLYAGLADGAGEGINRASIQIFLDGQNVTREAEVGANSISYRPSVPLAPGNHTALVVAADLAGNAARSEWHFRVVGPDLGQALWAGAGGQEAPGHGPVISASHPLAVTFHGRPGDKVACSLPAIARDIPLREVAPGTYEGTYAPVAGASCPETPVMARVKGDGIDAVVTAPAEVSITADPPPAPTILYPADGAEIGDSFDIGGRAFPGALVLATVSYRSRSATGAFEIDGDAASFSARADAKGGWAIKDVRLSVPWLLTPDRVTRFTVQAVAEDAAGKASEATANEVMHS